MAFALQEAFVVVSTKLEKLKTGLARAQGMVVSGLKKAGLAAMGAMTLAVGGLTAALAASIPLVKMGSDMEEMKSKFTAVFKEEEAAAREFASGLAKSVGRSQLELEGFMSSLQDLFVPMGFARKDARHLSQTVTQLGVDLASFNNMSDAEAISTLNAGLTGSHEVLKKFGVFINDNVLSLKLQEMGLAKNAQVATEEAKALARLQIIMEGTTDAQGDAARTADGFANQWKRLKGTLFDLASQIGSALLPAAKSIVTAFGGWVGVLQENESTISGWAARFGEIVTSVFEYVQGVVGEFVAMFQQNWAAFGESFTSIWTTAAAIVVDAVQWVIGVFIDFYKWTQQLVRATVVFTGLFSTFASTGGAVISVWERIKATANSVFTYVREVIEAVVFTLLNWDLTTRRIGISIAEVFTNLWRRITNFAENSWIAVQWFFDNWRDIAFTTYDYISTIFKNLGQNIRDIWQAVLDFFWEGEFKFDWTPLLDGARSTIKKMPEFKAFEAADFSGEWDELDRETQRRMDAWQQAMKDQAPKTGEETAEAITEGMDGVKPEIPAKPEFNAKDFQIQGTVAGKQKQEKSSAGQTTDIASVWQKIQEGLFKSADKVPEKQLKVQEMMLAEQKKTNENLAKKGPATYAA